jgi:hypothetical protein
LYIFSNLFQRIPDQREILRFLIPILNFWRKKFFFALIRTFFKLWLQMRRKRLKKTENCILWMCLRMKGFAWPSCKNRCTLMPRSLELIKHAIAQMPRPLHISTFLSNNCSKIRLLSWFDRNNFNCARYVKDDG